MPPRPLPPSSRPPCRPARAASPTLTWAWLTAVLVGCADVPTPTDPATPPVAAAPAPSEAPPPVPSGPRCPPDMVPVPSEAPRYCFDRYEASVVDGVARSVAGVMPSQGLSFDGAVAACARAEVRDAAGVVVGHKRLALASEWEDAADGKVGRGGSRFPYGDHWKPHACNVPEGAGPRSPTEPTGARPGCVSAFGAHDLLGNAWEWTDSGQHLDIAGWLARRKAEGLDLTVNPDGRLRVTPATADALWLVLNAVEGKVLTVFPDHTLGLTRGPSGDQKFNAGFLVPAHAHFGAANGTSADLLPILVIPASGGTWSVLVRTSDDGRPIPDKRGCASYAGSPGMCAASVASLTHPHDFTGSIAPRCVADPLPE